MNIMTSIQIASREPQKDIKDYIVYLYSIQRLIYAGKSMAIGPTFPPSDTGRVSEAQGVIECMDHELFGVIPTTRDDLE